MLIPYSTDAPLYHYPISTIGLIVINVLFFVAFCIPAGNEEQYSHFVDPTGEQVSMEQLEDKLREIEDAGGDIENYVRSLKPVPSDTLHQRLILQFGQGYKPWQWVTAMFMHADIMHLLGNMIFLWSFGLIVEGKIGNVKFPLIYLGLGIAQAIVVQTLMLFSSGGALGASGAIFSLLALVVIWAPVNTFDVVLLLFRGMAFEIPIMIFGFIYFAMNFTFFFIGGAGMSSEALHLIGLAVGIPVGFVMLTRGYVDCEGYDIISYMSGTEGRDSKVGKRERRAREKAKRLKKAEENPEPSADQTNKLFSEQINLAISQDNIDVALALHAKLNKQHPGTAWEQSQLFSLIQKSITAKRFDVAERLMLEHIDLFEHNRFRLQAKLLQLWLHQQRPRYAMRYLKQLNVAFYSEEEKHKLRALAAQAKKQIASGVLEVE